MRCDNCKRKMMPLFISYVCNHCDGIRDEHELDRGFVVWRGRPWGSQEYVFRTRKDAERWRVINGLHGCPIREVLTEDSFNWRRSGGFIEDLELADHLFEVFEDHRYEPGPHRAFIAA